MPTSPAEVTSMQFTAVCMYEFNGNEALVWVVEERVGVEGIAGVAGEVVSSSESASLVGVGDAGASTSSPLHDMSKTSWAVT